MIRPFCGSGFVRLLSSMSRGVTNGCGFSFVGNRGQRIANVSIDFTDSRVFRSGPTSLVGIGAARRGLPRLRRYTPTKVGRWISWLTSYSISGGFVC
jgi:hypothetical protein